MYLSWRPHSACQPAELIVPDGPQRDGVHDGVRQRHPVRGRPRGQVNGLAVGRRVHLRSTLQSAEGAQHETTFPRKKRVHTGKC